MPFRFFVIPVRDDGSAAEELNAFLASHRVLTVDRRWVEQGCDSFWSICVDFLPPGSAAGKAYSSSKARKDYREILSAEQFAVFARLRDLRKEIAQAEGVPVYVVFTNEQLAQMVQSEATAKSDLERIMGVGDSRIEKYGQRFLEAMAQQAKETHESDGQSV